MASNEIEVPKEVRQFMHEGAEKTSLGHKNGSIKQYRYGNLHIREYDDKFLLHMDKFDPRKNPLSHLIFDAPEVLIGLACAAVGGSKVASYVFKNQKSSSFVQQKSIISGLLASIALGYLGYYFSKLIKNN
jgi:hypothetical protein